MIRTTSFQVWYALPAGQLAPKIISQGQHLLRKQHAYFILYCPTFQRHEKSHSFFFFFLHSFAVQFDNSTLNHAKLPAQLLSSITIKRQNYPFALNIFNLFSFKKNDYFVYFIYNIYSYKKQSVIQTIFMKKVIISILSMWIIRVKSSMINII